MLDDLLDLLFCLHCTQVEGLDNRSSSSQLWRVIRRRRKLFDDLASNTSRGLLPPHNRAVSKITLDKENHLLIADEYVVATDYVQPPLYRCLQARLIFLGASACRSCGWWYCGHDGLRTRGDQVLAELHEFRVYSSDVAELGSPELG